MKSGYVESASGTCTTVSKENCESIAIQLGVEFEEIDHIQFAPGCVKSCNWAGYDCFSLDSSDYHSESKMVFNLASQKIPTYCKERRQCLCVPGNF